MSMPAARVTDLTVCPMVTGIVPHVGGPLLPGGAPTTLVANMPTASITAPSTCVGPPGMVAKGSATVLINKMPAARITDSTAHGGLVTVGAPTTLIGG
jgi:uncharacterized Zn-binding protein involved in type VI secretion